VWDGKDLSQGNKRLFPASGLALAEDAPAATVLHLALLTGNYREAAEIKLTYFELWDYFEWGAFSDDAADRNALVPIARQRAEIYDVPPAALERVIVIGDTPYDIECARVAGAQSIAVATGGHSVDELRAAGGDVVLADLSDTRKVLALLGVDLT
jgi:phosphoglycolate phosphatase-like HAD superfamily hydrolase